MPRRPHDPLAGRSNRQRADGHYVTLPLCTRLCSKDKADLESEPTSKIPDALPSPPKYKSPHSKGKVGPALAETSKRPGALPAPHEKKSSYPKGKVGPENAPTSIRPGALPVPPQ